MKHFPTFNHTARRLRHNIIPGVLIAGTLSFMISCSTDNDSDTPTPVISSSERMGISETEPVERDWDAIQEEGVLRMITRFNSSSYFLHRGEEKGFEYEFARAFAKAHDLQLEVVIVGNDDHPIDILNTGKGDFIAANYSITPERDEFIDFTASYNEVDQVLVFPENRQGDIPGSLEEAAGIEISVRSGSSYATTLRDLKETHGYSYIINELPEMWDAEAIMFALADGEFEATVADENLFRATSNYIDGVVNGPVVKEADQIAWGIRGNAAQLKENMDAYITRNYRISEADGLPRRSSYMNILRRRYYEERPESYHVRSATRNNVSNQVTGYEGFLSPYDRLVQPIAEEAGVDWKLVIAVMAQESRFDPYAESWMGAKGLMQIIPRFSQVQEHELWDPETNVKEGVRYIKEHMHHYAYMDSVSQISFALATYNAGMGHMADARRLTMDRNRDPNNWDHVAESLLLLMQPRHFRNARHGFVRGTEPVNYVKQILKRYETYDEMAAFASEDPIFRRFDEHALLP